MNNYENVEITSYFSKESSIDILKHAKI